MKKYFVRSFALALAIILALGVLANPALAADVPPGNYISIRERGSTTLAYYSDSSEAVILKPNSTYEVEIKLTNTGEDVDSAYLILLLNAPETNGIGGSITATLFSSPNDPVGSSLSYQVDSDIELGVAPDSYRLYCSQFPDGSAVDTNDSSIDYQNLIQIGELASGDTCRLTFDLYTKSSASPTGADGTEPSSEAMSEPSEADQDPDLPRTLWAA